MNHVHVYPTRFYDIDLETGSETPAAFGFIISDDHEHDFVDTAEDLERLRDMLSPERVLETIDRRCPQFSELAREAGVSIGGNFTAGKDLEVLSDLKKPGKPKA